MKVLTTKQDLGAAIKVLGNAVDPNDQDLASHFVFWHRDGQLDLLSNNNDRVFSSTPLQCEVSDLSDTEPNWFTLEANRIRPWLKEISGKVSLTLNANRVVVARVDRGKVTFRSKDPSTFPFWDSNLEKAKCTGKIKPERLIRLLEYSSRFISDDDSRTPEIASCEFREGNLYSMDSHSVCIIAVGNMEKSTARIWGKETGKLISFLKLCDKGSEVEMLETPGYLFLRNSAGAVFGQTRSRHEFPELDLLGNPFEEAHHWWKFNRKEALSALRFLIPAAIEDRYPVLFTLEGSEVVLSLPSAAGDLVYQRIGCLGSRCVEGVPAMPERGFALHYRYLGDVLKLLPEDEVEIGFKQTQKKNGDLDGGGYASFKQVVDEDTYLTVLGRLIG